MITLDTNQYVSAIWFGGKPADVLAMALKEEVQVAISQPILDETLRVLREKFKDATKQAPGCGSRDQVLHRHG